MMEKARISNQANHLMSIREDKYTGGTNNGAFSNFNQEKGLIMVEIDLKRPMIISFMNKNSMKIL
jgi:hypothetical protein